MYSYGTCSCGLSTYGLCSYGATVTRATLNQELETVAGLQASCVQHTVRLHASVTLYVHSMPRHMSADDGTLLRHAWACVNARARVRANASVYFCVNRTTMCA